MQSLIHALAIYTLPLIFAIFVPEALRAWLAARLGNTAPGVAGRAPWSPLARIDPLGTILFPLALAATGGVLMLYGWARRAPINLASLRYPRRDLRLLALAIPVCNLVMAILWAVLLKGMLLAGVNSGSIQLVAIAGISVNLYFTLLSFIPILPQPLGEVIWSLLPAPLATYFAKIEPYGMYIVMILIFTGLLGSAFTPALDAGFHTILLLFNIR